MGKKLTRQRDMGRDALYLMTAIKVENLSLGVCHGPGLCWLLPYVQTYFQLLFLECLVTRCRCLYFKFGEI